MNGILKMIRYSYFLPRFLIILLIYLFFYFFFDPIFKFVLIRSLQGFFEAKVEILKLKTSFLNPSIEIYDFSAGNKNDEFKNIFEFKKLKFSLKLEPLFEKKLIIEDAILNGLIFDTPRKKSCRIIKNKKKETPSFVKKYANEIKDYTEFRFDSLSKELVDDIKIEFENLTSIRLLNKLEEKYQSDYKNILEAINFDKYNDEIERIKKDFYDLKKEKNFIRQLKMAGEIKKRIENLQKDFKKDKDDIDRRILELKVYYTDIEKAKKADIENLTDKLKLTKVSRENIEKILFGKNIYENFLYYYSILENISKYIPENPKKKIFEERGKRGRIIRFPKKDSLPSFLLKNLSIDGYAGKENKILYKGRIVNITSEPYLYKHPLLIDIYGKNEKGYISLKSEIEIYNNKSNTYFEFKNMSIKNINFGVRNFAINVKEGFCDIKADIKTVSNRINGVIDIFFHDVIIVDDINLDTKKSIVDIIRNSILSVKNFNLSINISGDFTNSSINFSSSLGKDLSKYLNSYYEKKLEDIKKDIERKIDLKIKDYKIKIEKDLETKKIKLKKDLEYKAKNIDEKINDILNSLKF